MSVRENAGCAFLGASQLILSILGAVIHVWTIIIAFTIKGLFAAVATLVVPVLSQMYWFFKIGSNVGYTNNFYCMAIIAYVVVLGLFLAGLALVAGKS